MYRYEMLVSSPNEACQFGAGNALLHTTGLPHFQFAAFSSFLLEIGIMSKIELNFAKK